MTASEIEKQIYDEYYNRNPQGDARHFLWPEVIRARQDLTGEALCALLEDVKEGDYD